MDIVYVHRVVHEFQRPAIYSGCLYLDDIVATGTHTLDRCWQPVDSLGMPARGPMLHP